MLLVFGQTDGSVATNSEGSTVVITNANNEVVANTLDLWLERYTAHYTPNGGNDQILVLLLK
jgi:hypothetical protein